MNPILFVGLLALGWAAGLTVNYLADVLPRTRSFSRPVCRWCEQPLAWRDYLLLRRCGSCRRGRAWRVWVVQGTAMVLTLFLGWLPQMTGKTGFWPGLALLVYFGVVIVIDMEHHLILHPVSLVGAVICGWIGFTRHGPLETALGGAAGFGFMLVVYWLAAVFIRWVRRRRGMVSDEEAMGFGDVSLSGVLGLLLGWPGIAAGLILAFLLAGLGSLMVIAVLASQRKFEAFGTFIPYGPYLVLAAALLIFQG